VRTPPQGCPIATLILQTGSLFFSSHREARAIGWMPPRVSYFRYDIVFMKFHELIG
jgi:hypothetical protein